MKNFFSFLMLTSLSCINGQSAFASPGGDYAFKHRKEAIESHDIPEIIATVKKWTGKSIQIEIQWNSFSSLSSDQVEDVAVTLQFAPQFMLKAFDKDPKTKELFAQKVNKLVLKYEKSSEAKLDLKKDELLISGNFSPLNWTYKSTSDRLIDLLNL